MDVRIYCKSKNTMQSGRAKTGQWILELEETSQRSPEDLNGWTSCEDTRNQIAMKFPTKEKAINYATKNNWQYQVIPQQERVVTPRNFADNFKYIPVEE